MKKTYRLVEKDKYGNLKTLFYGINKSRILPINKWIKADIKLVSEGVAGKKYLSGFHSLGTLEECLRYSKKFKRKENRYVIPIKIKNIRMKEHSTSTVYLSEYMKIEEPFELTPLSTTLG